MFPNHDPSWNGGAWSFGWVVPLVFLLVLAGVVIWAVVRLTRQPATGAAAAAGPARPAPPSPPRDSALEQARIRYAQGQIDRETFLQIAADLAPPAPGTEEPTVPEPPA